VAPHFHKLTSCQQFLTCSEPIESIRSYANQFRLQGNGGLSDAIRN